ncbi:MAG TPA: HAD family hydrolase, partial [Streptosporangiaceae bacterium]|nr:HAD family hydrolase [Streptosporangiaceae bacterium]
MRRVRDPDALLQAVMFDMDGLLVNTEPLWFEVQSEIMARLGGTWSHADQAKLVGGSLTNSAGYLRAKAAPVPPTPPGGAAAARHLPPGDTGPDGDHAPGGRRRSSPAGGGPAARQWPAAGRGEWPPGEITVAEWLVETMVDRIAARGAPPMPGAAELLTDVAAADLPRALVTSSRRSVMDAVLGRVAKASRVVAAGFWRRALDVICVRYGLRARPDIPFFLFLMVFCGHGEARGRGSG